MDSSMALFGFLLITFVEGRRTEVRSAEGRCTEGFMDVEKYR